MWKILLIFAAVHILVISVSCTAYFGYSALAAAGAPLRWGGWRGIVLVLALLFDAIGAGMLFAGLRLKTGTSLG